MGNAAAFLQRIGSGLLALGIISIPGIATAQSIGPTGEVMTPPPASSAANNSAASRQAGVNPFFPNGSLSGAIANPFVNPYLNPLINPLAGNQSMTPQNAALYMFAAQQSLGGIGSGRLSGSRGGSAKGVVAAGPPPRGGANVPGAGASQFFGRGAARNANASRYFTRQGRHFPGDTK